MTDREIETLALRLEDEGQELKNRAQAATDLRDGIERWSQSGSYPAFLARLIPVWLKILDGPPNFVSTSLEQRLRNHILETIHRLPMTPTETLEPYAVQIVDRLLGLMRTENEDNATLCVKIVMDLQRAQTKILGSKVQPFLDIIQEIFEGMDQLVKDTFSGSGAQPNGLQASSSPRPASPATQPAQDPSQDKQQNRPLQKGMSSFKVMAELPIVVVSIFQAYRDVVQDNVTRFAPLIKNVLLLQAAPQQKAHAEAKENGTVQIGVAKEIKNRAAFADFITAQVKTMSFLAYVLRMYGQKLQDFLVTIPDVIIRLLRDCPKERCSTRKELLVAIRHIVNFNFRKIFLKSIEDLLDERTLLGDGLAVQETLRPLAFSLLADLIHHVRESLSLEQIRATVRVYTRNLREQSPSTSFQTMSAKLLLNMAEGISKLEDKKEARFFLMSILDAIADKFAALNRQYANAAKVSAQTSPQSAEPSSADFLANPDRPPDWDKLDIFHTASIKVNNPRERSSDPVSDHKFLFKNLVGGLKSIFYNLKACNPSSQIDASNAPPNWNDVASGFSPEEIQILIKLFHEGVSIFRYYEGEKPPSQTNATTAEVLASHHVICGPEEKALLESFATVFHHVDPAAFHEVFHSQIPHLYEMMFEHPALVHIPQFLLASEATSPSFAGMLLQFLMDRIGEVGAADVDKATILLRLFKLAFMAVTLFSQHNELVLLPHVNELITKSIKLSATAEAPMHYFYLLRSLFRSIGGGRFEHLYKEILPLLEMLLEFLNNLIAAARKPQERDLYVELSLTVPARLSNLLPHLSYLMKPLVLALKAGTDLVGQGLRTLELCVDNLTADYLDPIMAPFIDDLMAALWDHLKPLPYSHFHAHTTMRILGKLGGRNRKFLEGPPKLTFEKYVDGPAKLDIKLIGTSKNSHMSALLGSKLAIKKLQETPKQDSSKLAGGKSAETAKANDLLYKKEALKLIITQIRLFLGAENLTTNFDKAVRLQANDLADKNFGDVQKAQHGHLDREKSPLKKIEQQNLLKDLIEACMFATSLPELQSTATDFLNGLYKHMAVLEIGRECEAARVDKREFSIDASDVELRLNSSVLIDAIVESLSADQPEVRDAAVDAITAMYGAASTIFGSKTKVPKLTWFTNLLMACCHSCYQEEWYSKAGGSLGINTLATKIELGQEWLLEKEAVVCRALMYAAKDLPDDLPENTRSQALGTLDMILKRCNEDAKEDDAKREKAKGLAGLFVTELAHTSKHVRLAAQNALNTLSGLTGFEVHELVAPTKNRLLTHVFNKPLRALPFPIQIGYIDAVSFCLRLQNGILETGEPTTRFVKEVIHLAEQDDEAFAAGRPMDQRAFDNIVRLRVSCLQLLSLSLDMPEFTSSPSSKARPKIISVFFKQLYTKAPEVVNAADEALKAVVERDPKLPKDVLQTGLRPVLASLQNPSTLRIDVLKCLARLLLLLKSYFKVEIGARLLDNVKAIADAVTLQKASFVLVEQHDKINLVSAILNIFHLLPPGAKEFLDRLVSIVLELEGELRRSQYSPFREPIIKYLNKYPQEAWDHFTKDGLVDHTQGRFFAQVLADPSSGPIRAAVGANVQKLVEALNSSNTGDARRIAVINVIHIAHSIAAHSEVREPLLTNEDLRRALIGEGKNLEQALQKNEVPIDLRLATEQAGQQLMTVLTTYLSDDPKNIDCLFELIQAICAHSLRDSPSMFNFIYKHIVCNEDVAYRRGIITKSIDAFTSKSLPEPVKTYALRNLVSPIIAKDIQMSWGQSQPSSSSLSLVNKSLMSLFRVRLWQPQSTIDPTDDDTPTGIDHSRIELLQLTAMLLKYRTSLVQEDQATQRQLIHFGWNYIRLEDVINKFAAYVVLAYFVSFVDTPPKVVTPIYQSLLTSHSTESRSLVNQALEILAPVIPIRMNVSTESRMPLWARIARRPLLEDPSNLSQMLSIFQFVARHPDLFYDAKEQLSQTIITSIHKVAQLPSPSMESKKTALSLVTLIWNWEQKYAVDAATPRSPKRKADGEEVQVKKQRSFLSSNSLRMVLIKYLVQFIASLPDRFPVPAVKEKHNSHPSSSAAQSAEICRRAVTLFHNFLSPEYWSDLDIDAMFPKITEPILTNDPKEEKYELTITRIVNTLQLLNVMVNVKSDEWVAARLPQLQKLLEKPVRNANPEVQECLYAADPEDSELKRRPMILRIAEALPKQTSEEELPDADAPEADFFTFLNTVAGEALPTSNNLAGTNILSVLVKIRPSEVDQHIPAMMKTLNHLHKEHLSPASVAAQMQAMAQSARQQGEPAVDLGQIEAQVDVIIKMIDILAARIVQLGDHRRPYLAVLTTLVEKSPSVRIGMKILDIVNHWIFHSGNQVFPTLKEKNAVIVKMMGFEHRPDPTLFNRFLETIISVYKDDKITRSELAIRLEPAFLVGMRAPNVEMRKRFIGLFDSHLTRTASRRLLYLLVSQNWDALSDSFWLSQVIELLFGSIEMDETTALGASDFTTPSTSQLFGPSLQDARLGEIMVDDEYESFMAAHARFCRQAADVQVRNFLDPLCLLQHTDASTAYSIWKEMFPMFWQILNKDERTELQTGMIGLMTRDFHSRGLDRRPNCVQALLEGVTLAQNPRMNFPHHLMKFLAKTYDAWYIATTFMEQNTIEPLVNTPAVRESNQDALAETYAGLEEGDLFYGLWRRRCQYLETNTALSYEQHGNWEKAQRSLEAATMRARTGAVPFSQGEYMLWEDHWVLCAQKLQQWDILTDFAKMDNLNDLYLDSVWRNFEMWNNPDQRKQLDSVIKSVSDAPTPRRAFFNAFMALLKLHNDQEPATTLSKACDDATQLSIRKWHQLPRHITNAHIPILQNFQQLVELQDAHAICSSLSSTNANNLDQKAPELKLLLGTWRDRLPNFWDDINAWQDLVTWRRHVFQMINNKYLNLVPQTQTGPASNSFAFRGYHETAWTINKFAHVARKHRLSEVCIAQLSTIYTLPNIEIQEAFLKLREQAKCHLQNGTATELQAGLDVINNTNLNYFAQQQKAEFYTLKGMFLTKQGQMDDANEAFGSALYFDLKLPKAWAEWARYNENLFKQNPADLSKAAAAISCYLEAAGTYKSSKSRKALSRILWLLSLDNSQGILAKTFLEYKGEMPLWYWITFIPQLLWSLSRPEARIAHSLLVKIARLYPQALYYSLRTTREDQQAIRRQHEQREQAKARQQSSPQQDQTKKEQSTSRPGTADGQAETPTRPQTANSESMTNGVTKTEPNGETTSQSSPGANANSSDQTQGQQSTPSAQPAAPKRSWELVDDIVSVLKTAFPLLALTMETMVDLIARHFKSPSDDDAYRLISALLHDAEQYVTRSPMSYAPGAKLPPNTELNVARFAENILPPGIRKPFEADFVSSKPDVHHYITRLRKWRDSFEERLDRRPPRSYLENTVSLLSEFKFQKFDEVEVPGQYLPHVDSNKDFVRIERFLPDVELVRGIGYSYRRLKIRGHDGSLHPFGVQHPAPRTTRREERMIQLFRFFNDSLSKKKESRRRKLQFTLPVQVLLAPGIRMVQDDASQITLQGIYEDYCRRKEMPKDEPILFLVNRLRELNPKTPEHAAQIRQQVHEHIQAKMCPTTVVTDFFAATYDSFGDYWLFRRQFSYQLAALSFMTYIMFMRDRTPARMTISRETGNVWGTDLVVSMVQQHPPNSGQSGAGPRLHNNEVVPWRLTPNLQMAMGPIAMEGIYASSLLVIAKALTEPDQKLESYLSLFIRDEIYNFYTSQRGSSQNAVAGIMNANALRDAVQKNSEAVCSRALALARTPQGSLPANQTVVDLISKATNPAKLSQMDALWMSFL